jgi:septal ring factor EnvC (AmiA/AmiB activator)
MVQKIRNDNSFVDEIAGNKTAIKIVLDSCQKIEKENKSLKKQIDTLNSNVEENKEKKRNTQVALVLAAISSLLTAFAINLLTADKIKEGVMVFIPGIVVMVTSLYFSLKN